jgi:hypothetical protein
MIRALGTTTGDARARLRAVPPALWVVLAVGVVLRVLVTIVLRPAVLTVSDTSFYVDQARDELFSNRGRPGGYPAVLRALHAISADVDVTIVVQHLTGLATACIVFAGARRLSARPWLAVAAAFPVACDLDVVFFEHTLGSETFYMAAVVAGCYAAIRAMTTDDRRHALGWLALAGLLFGGAAVTRSILVPVLPLILIWTLVAAPSGLRPRLSWATAFASGALAVLLAYAALSAVTTDRFAITASGSGLYSRVAQIADCRKFTPPAGTAALCEDTPPAERPGPDFYAWEPGSPAVKLFGPSPNDPRLTTFAKQVILHQPVAYLRVGLNDVIRYFVADWNPRPFGGVDETLADIDRRAPGTDIKVLASINSYYADEHARTRGGAAALQDLQQALRVTPLILLVLTLLAGVSLVTGSGMVRRFAALALLLALGQIAVSAFGTIYSARYALPSVPILALAAAVTLDGIIKRGGAGRECSTGTP